MDNGKFRIPLPDENTIQMQIQQIVDQGLPKKMSFMSYLKSMYQHIGLKHLFSDRIECAITFITAIAYIIIAFYQPERSDIDEYYLYGLIFLLSPILFIALSIYTYSNKIICGTFELEMSCKYNVFQIIAFRMLVFSIIAILLNTATILLMIVKYEHIQFFRAFMISNTGLFTFSVLFLFIMMKRRSKIAALATIGSWTFINLILLSVNSSVYREIVFNLPLIVYALVILATSSFYIRSLNRLIQYQQAEGV